MVPIAQRKIFKLFWKYFFKWSCFRPKISQFSTEKQFYNQIGLIDSDENLDLERCYTI